MNALGVQNFERVESVMSVVKIIALVGFIVIVGVSVAFGLPHLFQSVHSPATGVMGEANVWHAFAPHGVSGILQSMLIVIFAFSGIGVFGALALSFLLPENVYNLLISASSYFTFLNWSIIMGSYLSWRRQPRHGRVFHSFLSRGAPVTTWITLARDETPVMGCLWGCVVYGIGGA